MELMITNKTDRIIEITDTKKTVLVSYYAATGAISVCQTSNSSHRAFGGMGKTYGSWVDAVNGYKSAFMRNAIKIAKAEMSA